MDYCYLDTPLGDLLLAGDAGALCLIGLPEGKMRLEPQEGWKHNPGSLLQACSQLREYFSGERKQFDLPLRAGGTEFQLEVLQELQRIPYGQTTTYSEIARRVGRPKAVRAVGAANGRNPIPIVIPCHRVIGSNGDLTGFGGGIEAKRTLLLLEAENCGLPGSAL